VGQDGLERQKPESPVDEKRYAERFADFCRPKHYYTSGLSFPEIRTSDDDFESFAQCPPLK